VTDLVVLSLESWDRVWRRNQYLVAGLLATEPDLRVLFVEPAVDPLWDVVQRRRPRMGDGLREVTDVPGVGAGRLWRLEATKPLPRRLDPLGDSRSGRAVRRAVRRLGFRSPLLWVNDPGGARLVAETGWPALYDITDDWLAAKRSAREHDRLVRDEDTLLRECAEVVVCSPALAATKGAQRPVTLVPNAVDVALYRVPSTRPADLPEGPVALYVGTLHRDRMDLDLCVATARGLGDRGRLVVVGPVLLDAADRDRLRAAGVVLLGSRDRREIPAYLQHADVLVVPHVVDEFTDSLDPIKLYEYRAVARPVVSTPVAGFRDDPDPRTTIAAGGEFVAAVVAAVPAPTRFPDGVGATDVPSWADRVDQMRDVLTRLRPAARPV
jgi:teichuronic acid biosynthesis glycosyltransferase TuaH